MNDEGSIGALQAKAPWLDPIAIARVIRGGASALKCPSRLGGTSGRDYKSKYLQRPLIRA